MTQLYPQLQLSLHEQDKPGDPRQADTQEESEGRLEGTGEGGCVFRERPQRHHRRDQRDCSWECGTGQTQETQEIKI